jgi:putative redox protein
MKGSMMSNTLVTATTTARLSGEAGRALVTMRGHHIVVDAPLALGGPNEEVNPVDLLLAALATCATFISEYVAREEQIPLTKIAVTVAGDLDPRGMCGFPVDPKIQALRMQARFTGPTDEQAATLVQAIRTRCPIFTTLAQSVELEVSLLVEPSGVAGRPER